MQRGKNQRQGEDHGCDGPETDAGGRRPRESRGSDQRADSGNGAEPWTNSLHHVERNVTAGCHHCPESDSDNTP